MLKSITSKDLALNKIAEMFADGTISASAAVSMLQGSDDLDKLLVIIDCRMQATTNLMKAMLKEASMKVRLEKETN